MNRITTDCYVDVSGWTEEEVQQAAEIFKDAVGGSVIDNIEVRITDGYQYIMYLGDKSIFVGADDALNRFNRKTQLTKEEVFKNMDKGNDEMNLEYSLNNGLTWFPCKILYEGAGYLIQGYPNLFPSEGVEMYFEKDEVIFREAKKEEVEKEIEELDERIDNFMRDFAIQETLGEYLYEQGYRKTQ